MSTFTLSSSKATSLIDAMKKNTVMVIGDTMIDEYYWGDVQRISPEAPVPVVSVESITRGLGGATNVVQNLTKLAVPTRLISICGNDEQGTLLADMLRQSGCEPDGLFRSPTRPTTIKTRIIARQQQVIRADREQIGDLTSEESEALTKLFDQLYRKVSGVIISGLSVVLW